MSKNFHELEPGARERALEGIVRDTLWMARRYAHKRRTFAPSTVNQAIDMATRLGIDITDDVEIGRYAEDGDLGTWVPPGEFRRRITGEANDRKD